MAQMLCIQIVRNRIIRLKIVLAKNNNKKWREYTIILM